jgi:uncharacterized membrane protein YeiH
MSLLDILDHASVLVFAFLACLTAVGGGIARDVLLDRNPVFWVANPTYLGSALLAATLVFFTAHLIESRYRWIVWLDAFALAVAVPAGVGVALAAGQSWPVVLIMGMLTGTAGGLMRDVVANEVPMILRQGELYVTAAFAGSLAALCAQSLGGPWPLVLCAAVTFGLRSGSVAFGWRLPVYRPRPPRQ